MSGYQNYTDAEKKADAEGYADALNDCVVFDRYPEGTPEHKAYHAAVQLFYMDV